MSASIYWRPIKKGCEVTMNTPSNFIEALKLPRSFSASDFPFLNGVRAGNNSWDDAIEEIQDAILKHDSIEVFYEQ